MARETTWRENRGAGGGGEWREERRRVERGERFTRKVLDSWCEYGRKYKTGERGERVKIGRCRKRTEKWDGVRYNILE